MTLLSQLFPQPNPTYNRDMLEGYLTTKEAAEKLGVPEQTIRNLITKKRIRAEKVGSIWLIREDELEGFSLGKPGRPRKE